MKTNEERERINLRAAGYPGEADTDSRRVACPFCHAAIGETCWTKTGGLAAPHKARKDAAYMPPVEAIEYARATLAEQAAPVDAGLSPAALEYNAIPLELKNATRATIEQVEHATAVELESRLLELETIAGRLSRASEEANRAAYDADGIEIRIKHDYSNPNNVRDWQKAQARSAELRKASIEAGRAASTAQYAAILATKTESELAAELELKQVHAAIHEQTGGPNDSRAIACRESIAAILEEQTTRADARERAANLLNDPIAWSVADAYTRSRAAGEGKQAAYIAALRTARDAGYMPEERVQLANHAAELEQAPPVEQAPIARTTPAELEQEAQQDAANRDRDLEEAGQGRPDPRTPDHFEPDPPYLDPDTADRIARAQADITATYAACRDRGIADGPRLSQSMIDRAAEYAIDNETGARLLETARAAYTPGPEHEEQAPCPFCATFLEQYRAASVAELEQARREDEAIDRYYQIRLAGHSHSHAIAVSQAPIDVDNVTPALYELLRRQPPIWSTEERIRYARLDLETEHADRAVSVALLLEQAAIGGALPDPVEHARATHGRPADLPIDPYTPPAGATAHDADEYQIYQFSRDSFILTLWSVAGEENKAYRLVDKGRAIFQGTDYRPSPMHAWTTEQAAGGLLVFLTLAPGDTDPDYFNTYTADQTVWTASNRREDLQLIAEDLEKRPRDRAADRIVAGSARHLPNPVENKTRAELEQMKGEATRAYTQMPSVPNRYMLDLITSKLEEQKTAMLDTSDPHWETFTRRTNDPKLAWIESQLDAMQIPHRRSGDTFHAPILQVHAADLESAWKILTEEIDNAEDNDPRFGGDLEPAYTPAEPGTVSEGTMQTEDLIESFCAELERLQDPRAADYRAEYAELKTEADAGNQDAQDAIAMLLNESIWDAMQDHAPAGFSFTAHPGDGSDFGYWTDESED